MTDVLSELGYDCWDDLEWWKGPSGPTGSTVRRYRPPMGLEKEI